MMFPHCPGILLPCLIDDVAHHLLRSNVRVARYAGVICRWHDDAVERRYIVARFQRGYPIEHLVANFQHSRQIRAGRVARARNTRKASK